MRVDRFERREGERMFDGQYLVYLLRSICIQLRPIITWKMWK